MNTNPKNDGAHAADERLDEVRRTAPPSGGGLTNLQINERIATMCGWLEKLLDEQGARIGWWVDPTGIDTGFNTLNYAQSLDSCRKFESKLTGDDRSLYIDILHLVCRDENDEFSGDYFEYQWAIFNATPLQRCEAFLRMKGQWE